MPSRYAFTGPTRRLSDVEVEYVDRVVRGALAGGSEYSSGAAYGVDTACHLSALLAYPDARHRLVVPAAAHNTYLVAEAPKSVEVVRADPGRTPGASYMKRNDLLVAHCDVLIAFPETAEPVLRSGTWATVRRAENACKAVSVYPLCDS